MSEEPQGWQFKVRVEIETTERLEAQKKALGFHSSNALAAIYVHALATIPAEKVFEALAKIREYTLPSPRKFRK